MPTRLGAVAGKVVAETLDRMRVGSHELAVARSSEPRIVYLQSHIRTRRWFKDGKVYVWDEAEQNGGAAYSGPKTLRKVKGLG